MRKALRSAPLVDLPAWTLQGGSRDGYDLATSLALAGHQDKWIRLSAAAQRDVLGFAVFGKHTIHFDGTVFRVNRSARFGGGNSDTFTAAEITALARAKKVV